MKKIYFLIILLLSLSAFSFSQGRFSANVSNTSNVITFSIKPDITTAAGFSTVEYFLRYPTSTPAFTYGTVTVNTTNFPGMTSGGTLGSGAWEIEHNNPIYVLPGYNVDHFIYTAPAPISTVTTYTGGVAYDMISVPVSSAIDASQTNFEFVHQDTEDKYYLAITGEFGNDLRPLSFNNYFYPVTLTSPGPSGSIIYYQPLNGGSLPIKLTNFSATKKNNDAVLNWQVSNQDATSNYFELQRSFNGTDFKKFGRVDVNLSSGLAGSYAFTDVNAAASKTNVIYYRLKMVDKDERSTLSTIKNIRLTKKSFGVNVYPNPAREFSTVNIDMENESPIILSLTDAAGKIVQKTQFNGFKGLNQKRINLSGFESGSYLLKVNAGNESQTISIIKE